ncbi:class I SAM-dependent methyltransferase [Streptomyces sp. YIM 98790]|uniref:class I SAM-dependent methyltransferase n=1 Tax=Streptomyces sp. YIM 98790 TaxID=2689077 RepID=UPI0028BE771A|nr:class I SAM-dependent methyltransferase [Streptomyces sp. YIM 98790]
MTGEFGRGGPRPAWWDRWYETGRPEYIDLPEHGDEARRVLRGLDRFQRLTGGYRLYSRLVAREAAGLAGPRILELGAGRGRLAERMLKDMPDARVTVSDIRPESLEAFRRSALAADPRTSSRVIDATAIDAPDGTWDVAVFTASLHHLEPPQVRKVLAEGTRAARRLLIVDAWRHPVLLGVAPLMLLTGGAANLHDGVISLRKVYSASAVRELAASCGAPVEVRTRFCPPGHLVVSAARAQATAG